VRTNELCETEFEDVTVDKGNVGPAGELCAQNGNKPPIQFDGYHAASAVGEVMRQCAEAGADFQYGVGFFEVGGGGDAGEMGRVDEEVLAQGFLQVEVVATDQFEW